MNKEQYMKDLKERQERHLASLDNRNWRPCLHDQCTQCHGTGRTAFGICIHGISCPCPKCSPQC